MARAAALWTMCSLACWLPGAPEPSPVGGPGASASPSSSSASTITVAETVYNLGSLGHLRGRRPTGAGSGRLQTPTAACPVELAQQVNTTGELARQGPPTPASPPPPPPSPPPLTPTHPPHTHTMNLLVPILERRPAPCRLVSAAARLQRKLRRRSSAGDEL